VNPDFYPQVSHAFDVAAEGYDALYGSNPIMAWMRQESLAVLRATFPPAGLLVEIGCGTGEEALTLSRQGFRIVATDISPAMIQVAQTKAHREGNSDVTWRVLPAGQLAQLVQEYGVAAFDGAYASFGGLNCEPQLDQLAVCLFDLLRPGASLVCSIMNRWCLWEMAWSLLHLQFRQSFRRLRTGWTSAGLASPGGSLSVPVRYYRPGGFAHQFGPYFEVQSVLALPVLLPPPYLDVLFGPQTGLPQGLVGLERRLRNHFPFYALGDHFLITLKRSRSSTRCQC